MQAAIGLGLDYQHRRSYGIGLDQLFSRFAGRLSHVSIVGLLNNSEADEFKQTTDMPILHHFTGVAPAGVNGTQLRAVRHQSAISSRLDALWCLEDIGIWNIGPYGIPYFAPPVLCRSVLESAISGINVIQQEVDIPFLAELPSCSFVVGDMSLERFFSELVNATGCDMVLDVSHVYSYALYSNKDFLQVLRALPLSRAKEIHVAGGSVHPNHCWRYRDTHIEPVLDSVIDILHVALQECPNLSAVTYEIGMGIEIELIDRELARLQDVTEECGFTPRL